jgi:hypothetical protein
MEYTPLSTKEIALTIYLGYSEIIDATINDDLTESIKQIKRTLTLRECRNMQRRIPQEELVAYDIWIIILESVFDLNKKIQPLTIELSRMILDYLTYSLFEKQNFKRFNSNFQDKLRSLLFVYFRLFAWNYLLDQTLEEKKDFIIYQSVGIIKRVETKFNKGVKKLGILEPISIKSVFKNTLPEINSVSKQFFESLAKMISSRKIIISSIEIKNALIYATKRITDLFY